MGRGGESKFIFGIGKGGSFFLSFFLSFLFLVEETFYLPVNLNIQLCPTSWEGSCWFIHCSPFYPHPSFVKGHTFFLEPLLGHKLRVDFPKGRFFLPIWLFKGVLTCPPGGISVSRKEGIPEGREAQRLEQPCPARFLSNPPA